MRKKNIQKDFFNDVNISLGTGAVDLFVVCLESVS